MTFAGWVRNAWRAWRLQHWNARGSFPSSLTRTYGSESERDRDLARLTAHGYRVAVEMDSGASIDLAPQNLYLAGSRAWTAGMEYELPLAKVSYVRDASTAGAPRP